MSDAVLIAIVSGVFSTIALIINLKANKKIDQYHKEVNGRMGELLETTKKLGNAEGAAAEKSKQKTK